MCAASDEFTFSWMKHGIARSGKRFFHVQQCSLQQGYSFFIFCQNTCIARIHEHILKFSHQEQIIIHILNQNSYGLRATLPLPSYTPPYTNSLTKYTRCRLVGRLPTTPHVCTMRCGNMGAIVAPPHSEPASTLQKVHWPV